MELSCIIIIIIMIIHTFINTSIYEKLFFLSSCWERSCELNYTSILQEGFRLRLRLSDANSNSVLLNISHITCTSWYSHVCTSSWSFKSPSPLRWRLMWRREERETQTRRRGPTRCCHQHAITVNPTLLLLLLPPPLINLLLMTWLVAILIIIFGALIA